MHRGESEKKKVDSTRQIARSKRERSQQFAPMLSQSQDTFEQAARQVRLARHRAQPKLPIGPRKNRTRLRITIQTPTRIRYLKRPRTSDLNIIIATTMTNIA
ncbi:Glutamyl-tRNA(Gln) amidotransferase subunit [Trichinella pseudospiralis]